MTCPFILSSLYIIREQPAELPVASPQNEQPGDLRLRAAVFSDTHIGIFANAMPSRRIAMAVNAVDPDLVLIAGDFTYFLPPERFDRAFGRFADIEAPVVAVLGNHDVGFPGPDVGAALKEYLKSLGIVDVENRGLAFSSAVEGSTVEVQA